MRIVALIAILALCGCTSVRLKGNILTITTRTLGIDISQDPVSETPHLRLGFITTQAHLVPTSTNAIYAPKVYSSIDVGQKLMSTQISEDYATGDGVERIDNTNFESPAKLGAKRPK